MSRRSAAGDRAVLLVLGLVLLVAGAGAAAWGLGQLGAVLPGAPENLSTAGAAGVLEASWWGAAGLAAGVVLVLLGLAWLLRHVPPRSPGALALRRAGGASSGGPAGRDRLDGGALADALAARVEQAHGVRSAHGSVVEEQGRLVAEVRAVVEPWADLRAVARGSDDAAAELHRAGGRDDLRPRVRLRVARSEREPRRSVA
ncbi:hypothetical protein WDV85_11720 [Pseudokineococcus sp. 5B2Z-1]|uniref:hypothetical protein n=1 Tax=Pseudokineococcus sp. 5B2Z-1 TaxID=3132744 RepID=UPI0030A79EC1